MAPGPLPVALLGPGHRWLYCEGGTPVPGQKSSCTHLHATLPREGVLSARPWTAVILHTTFLLKLSETLKGVYCNVNNLSLVAIVFLLQGDKSWGLHPGLCLRPTCPGWAPWTEHLCPMPAGSA